jgi:dihydroorotase-like cyclic amidohydrolase
MLRKLSTHRPSSFFEMNPPLRSRQDVEALWANLNVADCIATDHAPHTLEEKRGPHPPMGVPGLETMLPLLLTTAIEGRHPSTLAPHFPHSELASAQDASLRMQDIARLCCEGPAAAFNISRKGRIAPGFDADLTLVDPGDVWVIGERPLFTKCNWTPFAGWRVRGSVKKVFLRGQLAFDQGHIVAQKGSGKRVNM